MEEMDHDASVVENGPAAFPLAFGAPEGQGGFGHEFIGQVGQRRNLAGSPAAGDDQIIAEHREMGNAQDNNVLCFLFVEKGRQVEHQFLILHEVPPFRG